MHYPSTLDGHRPELVFEFDLPLSSLLLMSGHAHCEDPILLALLHQRVLELEVFTDLSITQLETWSWSYLSCTPKMFPDEYPLTPSAVQELCRLHVFASYYSDLLHMKDVSYLDVQGYCGMLIDFNSSCIEPLLALLDDDCWLHEPHDVDDDDEYGYPTQEDPSIPAWHHHHNNSPTCNAEQDLNVSATMEPPAVPAEFEICAGQTLGAQVHPPSNSPMPAPTTLQSPHDADPLPDEAPVPLGPSVAGEMLTSVTTGICPTTSPNLEPTCYAPLPCPSVSATQASVSSLSCPETPKPVLQGRLPSGQEVVASFDFSLPSAVSVPPLSPSNLLCGPQPSPVIATIGSLFASQSKKRWKLASHLVHSFPVPPAHVKLQMSPPVPRPNVWTKSPRLPAVQLCPDEWPKLPGHRSLRPLPSKTKFVEHSTMATTPAMSKSLPTLVPLVHLGKGRHAVPSPPKDKPMTMPTPKDKSMPLPTTKDKPKPLPTPKPTPNPTSFTSTTVLQPIISDDDDKSVEIVFYSSPDNVTLSMPVPGDDLLFDWSWDVFDSHSNEDLCLPDADIGMPNPVTKPLQEWGALFSDPPPSPRASPVSALYAPVPLLVKSHEPQPWSHVFPYKVKTVFHLISGQSS